MSKINKLKEIMHLLRDPVKGCPWDKEQNFFSIAKCTIEEAYEVFDAIEKNDMKGLKEELGDLLLQVIFHSQMAQEQELFDFEDVTETIINKLISRHPHVFGSENIKTAKEQEIAWENLKEKERKNNNNDTGTLDGIANSLPAMLRAEKLQKRAAKVGFDWRNPQEVIEKIKEETEEVIQAISTNNGISGEVGDLLFAVINLARKLNIDPEEALRKCNKKFETRFRYIEDNLKKQGKDINNSTLEEMDALWNQAKEGE